MNKIDTTVLKNTDKLAFSGFAFNKTASETVLPASGTIENRISTLYKSSLSNCMNTLSR